MIEPCHAAILNKLALRSNSGQERPSPDKSCYRRLAQAEIPLDEKTVSRDLAVFRNRPDNAVDSLLPRQSVLEK